MAGDPAEGTQPESGRGGELASFLLGTGSWFGAFGLHGVLFSSLLVVYLEESEVRVGAAQSAVMLPAVLLILVGGAVADRRDRRRLMMLMHGVGVVITLALSMSIQAGALSYGVVIAYALCLGTAQAFGNPARDSLLSEVVDGEMGRAVASMTLIQWGAQAVGALAGSLARAVGVAAALWGQALVFGLGILAFQRLPRAEPREKAPPMRVRDMTSGVREVWASPVLLPSLLLVCAVGVAFIGPFMVVFPLMVRDVYGGGVPEISLVSPTFPVGTIIGSTALVRRGGVRRKGPAQLVALLGAASLLLVISLGLPFVGTLACVLVWGACASVFMIAGRTLFQQYATEEHRARVLSTYTLGFMGAAGVAGAPLSGVLVSALGPLLALRVLGLMMFAVVGLVTFFSSIAKVD
jgi:MFS family permease